MNKSTPDLYTCVHSKALEIASELKRLNRWEASPPPPEKFENMGAFGSNTMHFERWLQFVLIPRIVAIVEERGDFPDESSLAPYAIRYFDGDDEVEHLREILYDIDTLINGAGSMSEIENELSADDQSAQDTVSLGDESVPTVIHTLAALLSEYEGDALESQLQTFDTFLAVLSPKVRPAVSSLLREAAKNCGSASRHRIESAADAVARGERAAEPYDHEKAMKKYMEEFKKGY